MSEYRGIEYLRKKLSLKRNRVLTRYSYYEMKNRVKEYASLAPAEFKWMSQTLG